MESNRCNFFGQVLMNGQHMFMQVCKINKPQSECMEIYANMLIAYSRECK